MPLFGNIIVIKRNGTDGISFPLTASSCLFGRRTECDIRIQLPQVSKEHCKIEVNENKEAVLTNLSTVNPTQLNGDCFQQPVPLKHGDVLTIIDRSFRFEYPLQSTPRKSRSRSPKDETLQVLHVQQVAEGELLHKQTSGSKSLPASALSAKEAECEEKNASENKPSTEKNVSTALPFKLQTPKSSQRMNQPRKKQTEMSPFSKLYEKLKHEIQVKKPLQVGNASQQAAKEDGKRVLLIPSARISSSSCVYDLGSLAKEKEIGRSEEIEECKIKIKKEVISLEFHQISAVGSATKKGFARSPPTSVSKVMPRDTGNRSHLQDHKELSPAGKSKGADVTITPRPERGGNATFPGQQCLIERLGYVGEVNTISSAAAVDKVAQTAPTTSIPEVETYVPSTPTSRRKSPRSHFISFTREPGETNPVNADTPNRKRVSLKRKSLSEMLAETHKGDVVSGNNTLKQLPLAENECLKQGQNSQQYTPGKHVQEVVLEEVCDQASFVSSKEGHSETPVSNTKSPRRNNRQSKELPNKSVCSETLAPEELTPEWASPASQKAGSGRKRGRPRTSALLTKTALETSTIGEHCDNTPDGRESGTKEELATKGSHHKQDLEDASAARPRRLSKRRSSGSPSALKDCEAGSETTISSPLAGEESGKTTKLSQKRKSGDSLLQPLVKRKRVSFGGHLSPELFDKSLPPNSPLKRGATPARLSLPFGNSPRAVLKKAPGLKHFAIQELSEHLQKEKMSPKNGPTQKSPAALSPASGRASPMFTVGSPAPYMKGRFSVSRVTAPLPIAEEDDALAEDVNTKEKSDARLKTPESSQLNQDEKTFLNATPDKPTQSAQPAPKVTPRKWRSGAVAVINAKRRSGASSANLLVAKSWAEVVKSGVVRPQAATVKKSVRKGRSQKKTTQSPKSPERKLKSHVSTGHAESPATIVVGRAYSTRVRTAGQVPKVVKNPILKLNMKMDESFTGMTEMFQTPENKSGKTLPLATVQQMDCTPTSTAEDMSELNTPEETGEMMVSPLNSSDASEQKQNSPGFCRFLRKESLKSVFDAVSTTTPGKKKAVLEENTSVDSWSVISEKQASWLKSGRKRTPKQKLEPLEVVSGIKQLFRTPEQRSEPVEALSGIKQLMKTPKQKMEPVEALSGIKQLLRTPKQKMEPVEALSGIKQLMKTPKQKSEPVEALSGIKQLLRTPKQKMEPVEALSGIKQLMKTPKQKSEPVEDLSGIKQLLRTPKQKSEPVEVLSGIKQLLRTPQQELEPVTNEIAFEGLLKTPVQIREALKDVAPVNSIKKTPKLKYQPVEDMVGVSRLFKTPEEKVQRIEDMFDISRLVRTPREKYQPVDDFVGLQRLMAEPRQKCSSFEVDYGGVKEMFHMPEEMKVRSVDGTDSEQDPAPPCANSSHKYEDQGNILRGEDSQQKELTGEDQSTHRPTRGRPRKTVHRASAKQCERDLNLKELQSLGEKSTQEEMGEISTSVAQNEGRGRRTNRCIQEEIVSKPPDEEKVETVSLVEPPRATQRPGRGKRKEPKELKHPTENLESCGKDSSVLEKEPADTEQALQERGTSDALKTADGPTMQTARVSSSIQSENCQLQTGLVKPENKSNEDGVECGDEKFLSPEKKSRRVNKAEITEPLILPKRGRRARNDPVKQASSEELHGTRKLRRDPSAKVMQRGEQTFDKGTETATAGESENGTKPEMKIMEKRLKSLRSARKHLTEAKTDVCEMALENTQNIQKTEESSAETGPETPSRIRNEIKVSWGDETENAQENTAEGPQRLKAESPCGKTNKMPVAALNLETNRSAEEATNRTRIRRGKAGALEKKSDEFAKGVHNIEPATPHFKSETEMEESSPKDSLGSVCVQDTSQVPKDERNPAAPSIPAANSLAHGRPKRTRNEQGSLQPKQMEILQENQVQKNGATCRRGRGRKVLFDLEEANLKTVEGKRSFPGDDKGMSSNDGQQETSENPPSQGRRGRRKQADSIPQIAASTSMAKQTLTADHRKDEAVVKEQDSVVEATPSSTEGNPLRRGRRREVAAASQTSRTLSVRTRRGVVEGDDEKMAEREDQNAALGKKTLQEKANASARDKRKKIDVAAEAKSSSPLQRKCGSSEADDKEEGTNEEQNMPLETEACAEERPLGRGRRRATALASRTTTYSSLRGKLSLSADHGREEAPKEDQNTPLESFDSSVKENQLRRGRRKEIAPLLEPANSTRGKRGLSKERGRQNNCREAKKLILENCLSQEKMDRSRGNSKQTITSLAVSSTSLQGLPEDGKNETPEEHQSALLGAAPSAEENPSRGGRKKRTPSKSEETSFTSLRENPGLPQGRSQKRVRKGGEDTALGHNSPQENTRQLRSKRRKVEFVSGVAPNVCSPSAGSEQNDQSAKGKEGNAIPRAASCRRKCQLPAEDSASKKPKSGNDENVAPQKGKRKMREDLGEEVVKAARTAGGTVRRTRASTRTRK